MIDAQDSQSHYSLINEDLIKGNKYNNYLTVIKREDFGWRVNFVALYPLSLLKKKIYRFL